MQNTFSQSGNDSKWFLTKIIFQNRYVAIETPSRPPPLHGKSHLKFPFWLFEPLPYYACDNPMMQFLGALKRVIFHTGLIFHQCFCICILYVSNKFNEKATSLQMWICTHHTNDWFLDGQIIHQFECECYIFGRWLQIFLWHTVIWLDLNSSIWQGSQWSWRLDTNWLG